MRQIRQLVALAAMALVPFALSAADHIVFIHGWQMFSSDRIDTWDSMVDCMTNSAYGTPYVDADKVLVVNYSSLAGSVSIKDVAKNVWAQIQRGFPDGSYLPQMDFVVHSMGGLVLRSMVEQGLLSDSLIDHVVTLASPHYGQRQNWSEQQKNMNYGSEFLWDLANATKKVTPSKMFCLVATQDAVVNEWSATLADADCAGVRYVEKSHSDGAGICKCGADSKGQKPNRLDIVYRMVTDFFSKGAVTFGRATSTVDQGAVLFQIVDGKGKSVAYDRSSLVSDVKKASGAKSCPKAVTSSIR